MATSCGFESHRPHHQNCRAISFDQCLLLREEQTPRGHRETDAIDPKQTQQISQTLPPVNRPDRAAYANMESYKPAASNRSSGPSAANQAREYIRSFKRFYPPIHRCSPNKPMTLMSATGRVSQTVEKLSSNRE